MATVNIEQRTTKKGIKFRARVRVRDPLLEKGYYEESNTFTTRARANHWATNRAKFLEVEGIPTKGIKGSDLREVTLANLIQMYLDYHKFSNNQSNNNEIDENDEPKTSKLGRNKIFALKAIAKRDISSNLVSQLTMEDIIDYAKMRKREGVSGYTTYQDIIYVKSVIAVAKSKEFMVNGSTDCITEALIKFKADIVGDKKVTKRDRLVEFSANERTHVDITEREMNLLKGALKEREQQQSCLIPYLQILNFAITTCMRVSEICRIRWRNFNEDHHTITIENRKHPTDKIGNHVTVPLIGGAFEIILERRKAEIAELKEQGLPFDIDEKIFPYKARSVTAGWQRSRKKLIEEGHNIQNIRFHDLRAHGATLLINKGWSLAKVSKVTGHRDMEVLNNIYNRMQPSNIAIEDYNERNGLRGKDKKTI